MEVRNYLIASIITLILKVVFGVVLDSNTLLASSLIEILFIVINIFCGTKENNKFKGVIVSFVSMLLIALSIGVVFYSVVGNVLKPSWWVLLILFIVLFVKYVVTCLVTISAYTNRRGKLVLGNLNSNIDFTVYGIVLGSVILCKCSKFLSILKYGDILGTILISLIIIYFAIKFIVNSIRYMEDKEINKEVDESEIISANEVKKVNAVKVYNYGGLRRLEVSVVLKDKISMPDICSFALSLQDYLLKFADFVLVKVNNEEKVVKKQHVRSKKEDARNSGSRNSKTNSKKKNTKKANKKR